MALARLPSSKSLLSSLRELYLLNKDDQEIKDGFVMVQNESIWTTLFVKSFLFADHDFSDEECGNGTTQNRTHDGDDMLFFVKKSTDGRQDEVLVYRKVARNLPGIGDPHYNWEETVYLNLILHELEYVLTCAVCQRLDGNELKVHERASVRVYASPHARRMDSKGESADQSYPYIFFMIDSFDDVFSRLFVQETELACVELVAKYKPDNLTAVVFSGSVGYKDLKRVYESKATMGSKMAKKMMLGWMMPSEDHVEFITMRGPKGKGYAEMAISEYKATDHSSLKREKPLARSFSDPRVSETKGLCMCSQRNSRSDDIRSNNRCSGCGGTLSELKDGTNDAPVKGSSGASRLFRPRKHSIGLRLKTHLTFVKLPWKCIMKDVLDTKQKPIFYKE